MKKLLSFLLMLSILALPLLSGCGSGKKEEEPDVRPELKSILENQGRVELDISALGASSVVEKAYIVYDVMMPEAKRVDFTFADGRAVADRVVAFKESELYEGGSEDSSYLFFDWSLSSSSKYIVSCDRALLENGELSVDFTMERTENVATAMKYSVIVLKLKTVEEIRGLSRAFEERVVEAPGTP